jgi:ElaB/YqjD/DUF883 family membrane-anchored ribosome-binding protein
MDTSPPQEIPPTATDMHAEIVALRSKVDELMTDRVRPAVLAVADHAETAAQHVTTEAEKLAGRIRERPLASIGLAALAGYVIAILRR